MWACGFSPPSTSQALNPVLEPLGLRRHKTGVEIPANAEVEITFFLGEAANVTEALSLATRYRTADLDEVFHDVGRFWDQTLGVVQVKTPDRAMDILLNGWLIYQTIVCRLWPGLASTRRAVPTASAINCKMEWHSVWRSRS